jgi:UPF0755 protein
MRRGRRWGLPFVLSVAMALAAGAAGVAWLLAPADPGAGEVQFEVRAGTSLARIGGDLERSGVVRSGRALVWLARARRVDARVRAGEYALSPAWPMPRVLEQLVEGRVITYEVTLPEGVTAAEIADRLSAQGLADRNAFLAVVHDPAVAAALGFPGPGLEGFLFPETYRMPRGLPPRQIVGLLVDQFRARWAPLADDAAARGLDVRQAVTLASIVEKETGVAEERPLVASVFENRLARGMRLESDPTTIYGIPDFDGNLRRPDLEDASNPWNTYRIAGLPPTPIANPGAASLAAVVHPAETDYLYFVARNDGTHVFARSYAQHLANVARYQRRIPQ